MGNLFAGMGFFFFFGGKGGRLEGGRRGLSRLLHYMLY